MLVAHAHCQPGLGVHNQFGGRAWIRLGLWRSGGRGDLFQAGPVACDCLHGVLGEVVPQVPAVSDLDRGRSTVAGAF